MADNCYELATDRIGCCVFQQCVKYSQEEPTERLVAGIIANALLLAQDQFGYVLKDLFMLFLTAQICAQYTSVSSFVTLQQLCDATFA